MRAPTAAPALQESPQLLVYLGILPTSCVGILLLPTLATGVGQQWIHGVLEIYGGATRWLLPDAVPLKGGATAMTVSHVLLGVDRGGLEHSRLHERVHVRQCERWGPLLIPTYLLANLVVWRQRLPGCSLRAGAYEHSGWRFYVASLTRTGVFSGRRLESYPVEPLHSAPSMIRCQMGLHAVNLSGTARSTMLQAECRSKAMTGHETTDSQHLCRPACPEPARFVPARPRGDRRL